MWGIIPAAGSGSRIQPLAFSKELLPVGSKMHNGRESPRAVSEYLVERMILAGATKLCFVISPGKADILSYFGSRKWGVDIVYVVQQTPNGLCDAVFRAAPLVSSDEPVVIGLPDTIWYPVDALSSLPHNRFSLLLFPVDDASPFDAVITDSRKRVTSIEVKHPTPGSNWIWGAM
ncbi:MAG: nucleotidyltransferase family protein, partial [Bradyrhizobium sp.]|nr:nucleotidyltransferase family protein [Bradyrhizobium sp.]